MENPTKTGAAPGEPGAEQPAAQGSEATQGQKVVPLEEHIAERKRMQAKVQTAERELELLKAEAKKKAEAEMSELQKAQAELTELKPRAESAKRYEASLKARLEQTLAGMPKERRELIQGRLEALPPDAALDLVEAFGLAAKPEPRAADVARGNPPPPKNAPTLAEIAANPKLLDGLDPKVTEELFKSAGFHPGGRVF